MCAFYLLSSVVLYRSNLPPAALSQLEVVVSQYNLLNTQIFRSEYSSISILQMSPIVPGVKIKLLACFTQQVCPLFSQLSLVIPTLPKSTALQPSWLDSHPSLQISARMFLTLDVLLR